MYTPMFENIFKEHHNLFHSLQGQFEETKGVARSRKSNDRQYNNRGRN